MDAEPRNVRIWKSGTYIFSTLLLSTHIQLFTCGNHALECLGTVLWNPCAWLWIMRIHWTPVLPFKRRGMCTT